jgi:hypothetical protein
MVRKLFLSIFILALTLEGFSQEIKESEQIDLPVSIFSSSFKTDSFIAISHNINDIMNLTSYHFMVLDMNDVRDGFFTLNPQNFNRTPTNLIYEEYRDIIFNDTFFTGFDLRKYYIR